MSQIKFLLMTAATICFNSAMAAGVIQLPDSVPYNAAQGPQAGFSKQVQAYFSITQDGAESADCKTSPYVLTDFLYRGEVDHTFVAVYGPVDRNLSWCWINLQSHPLVADFDSSFTKETLIPSMEGSGWNVNTLPAKSAWWNKQIYCQTPGQPSACLIRTPG
jgi:hypothetical protein